MEIQQSSAYVREFLLVLATDHVTGATGKTVTVTTSKAGAAFASPVGTVAGVGSGLYKVSYTAADTDTLGDLTLHATASGCDPTDEIDQIVEDPLGRGSLSTYASGTVAHALSRINSAVIITTNIVSTTGTIKPLVVGDTYYAADARSIDFTDGSNTWPDLTSAAILFTAIAGVSTPFTAAGSVIIASGTGKKVRLELSAVQTAALPLGPWAYKVTATLASGHTATLAQGKGATRNP